MKDVSQIVPVMVEMVESDPARYRDADHNLLLWDLAEDAARADGALPRNGPVPMVYIEAAFAFAAQHSTPSKIHGGA
jgi:hypothetical protein